MPDSDNNDAKACYAKGEQSLLLKDPYTSFAAYAKAVQLSTDPLVAENALESLLKLEESGTKLPGYQWIADLLRLGLAAKFGSPQAKQEVFRRAKGDLKKGESSCVILVGGSSAEVQDQMEGYQALLVEAFKTYQGILISGGSRTGISKLGGDLKAAYPDRIRTIGYLPASKMKYADRDPGRYSEIRTTDGATFSPLEATRYWMDIIASGINPASVKVLAINGGKISSAECKLAATLDAKLGILEGSGGEPGRLLSDPDWNQSSSIIHLANEAAIICSFISKNSVL